MQTPIPHPTVTIFYDSRRWRISLASVQSLIESGLTPIEYEFLDLTADAWGCTIPELMELALALSGEVRDE